MPATELAAGDREERPYDREPSRKPSASLTTPVPSAAAPSPAARAASSRELAPRSERGAVAPLLLPGLLIASLVAHAGVFAALKWLPPPAVELRSEPTELAFMLTEPPEPVLEVPPEPEPEPEPLPAAIAETPRPRRERDVEPSPEPPPPAPVMVAEGSQGEWAHPEGEEGGVLGGTPGGTGTGEITSDGAASEATPEPRRGISRAELRRRLLGYIRGTLSAYVNGRIDYPLAARREHLEGVVLLRIRLASDGRVLAVRLSRTSGYDSLDRAALASVERLETMPAPPEGIPWEDERELPLPVTYVIQ
jgi:protein TonB